MKSLLINSCSPCSLAVTESFSFRDIKERVGSKAPFVLKENLVFKMSNAGVLCAVCCVCDRVFACRDVFRRQRQIVSVVFVLCSLTLFATARDC